MKKAPKSFVYYIFYLLIPLVESVKTSYHIYYQHLSNSLVNNIFSHAEVDPFVRKFKGRKIKFNWHSANIVKIIIYTISPVQIN